MDVDEATTVPRHDQRGVWLALFPGAQFEAEIAGEFVGRRKADVFAAQEFRNRRWRHASADADVKSGFSGCSDRGP